MKFFDWPLHGQVQAVIQSVYGLFSCAVHFLVLEGYVPVHWDSGDPKRLSFSRRVATTSHAVLLQMHKRA